MVYDNKVKKVYSLIESTIEIDQNTEVGEAMVQQINSFACQHLRQGSPEFNQLYNQLERENLPHEIDTAMKSSKEDTSNLSTWLKSKDLNGSGTNKKIRFFPFGGDARHPQTGLSFTFGVVICFEFE